MASKPAQKRLSKEYAAMQKSPPPFVWAAPEEKNILQWHFIIRGPPDSPYHGGEYHGLIIFPSEYPFKPPGIKMLTPSGRFQPDKKICFSMSDFHPGTWNPAWSVATICTGILSFMLSDEITTGSITSTDQEKKVLAGRSHEWNIKQRRFQEIFPEYCDPAMKDLPNMGEADRGVPSEPPANPTPAATVPVPVQTSVHQAAPVVLPVATADASGPPARPLRRPIPEPWSVGRWVRNRWPYAAILALAVFASRVFSG